MYFNNCCPCKPSKEALDEKIAQRLWTVSDNILEDRLNRLATI
jgi:hypothetical protein